MAARTSQSSKVPRPTASRQVYRSSGSSSVERRVRSDSRRRVGGTPRGGRRPESTGGRSQGVVSYVLGLFYKNPGKVDGGFVATLMVLIVFGLLVLFSASYAIALYRFDNIYEYFLPQLIFAIVGTGIMFVASMFDYTKLKPFAWGMHTVSLVMLVAVLFMEPISGVHRWINMKGIPSIQASDIAKFTLILVLALHFSKKRRIIEERQSPYENFVETIVKPGIILGPILVLLYLEPHNSAMILMTCITASIMFMGGAMIRWFATAGAAAVAGFAVMLITRGGYVQERLQGWLDPFADMQDSTRQTGQSLYTIASGGLFGVGIGNSVQKHMWLPESQNDFIFAILCEELGFVGGVLCILLFALLVVQGLVIAKKAPDRFGNLLVVGCMAQIGFQALLNVAVVTNTIPNTGISLPFFSAGGTSLLMLMGQMGLVLSVCRAGNRKIATDKAQREQNPPEQPPKTVEFSKGHNGSRFR